MSKNTTKKLVRPNWYDDEFYRKIRSPEEWLYELWKRNQFKQDKIGLPHSIYILPIKEQEKCFIEFIFNQKIEKFLNFLEATPPQPIRYPSISDVFIMYHRLTNSDWYKNYPKREAFESAISIILNEGTLSKEQSTAFLEMHKTPWCAFYENHQQDSWCPKKEKEMLYLTGIPLSLNPGYPRGDIISILNDKLNAWVGKIQEIQLQFDTWQESKILAVFDLMLWFKMKRIKCKKIDLHKLIWPKGRISKFTGEEVNQYDDIDYSIGLIDRVINQSSIGTLVDMCQARKFEKETTDI